MEVRSYRYIKMECQYQKRNATFHAKDTSNNKNNGTDDFSTNQNSLVVFIIVAIFMISINLQFRLIHYLDQNS